MSGATDNMLGGAMSATVANGPELGLAESEQPSYDGLVVLAPLAIEARAVRSGAPWADVRRIGMGPRRAARSARRWATC